MRGRGCGLSHELMGQESRGGVCETSWELLFFLMAAGWSNLRWSCGLAIAVGLWGPRAAIPGGELAPGFDLCPFRAVALSELVLLRGSRLSVVLTASFLDISLS